MPSLLAAVKAAAAHRAQRAAAAMAPAKGRKSVIQAGPVMSRGIAGRPLRAGDWPTERAIDQFYKASALVSRPVQALATAVGSVRWVVEVLDGDQWRRDEGHPLQALLDQPHQHFNRQAWNEVLVMFLAIEGNSLFQKTAASGARLPGALRPRILELVPLGAVPRPVPDPDLWVSRYEWQGPPKKTWQPDEILHFMLPDPGNLYWGMSPLKPTTSVIQMDLKAVQWNLRSMDNRAIADGIYQSDSPLTAEQYEELKDQIWEQHQGSEHAHEPMVVGGAKYQPTERTPVEMDFNSTRKGTREEILSSLFTPPVVAGFFDEATLANAEVSRRLFWEDGTIPTFVERIAGGLNGSVVPHFGAPGKLRVQYDISGIPALREDLVKKSVVLRNMLASGVPYNEASKKLRLDLDPIPGAGDVPFGLEALRPSRALPADVAPPDPPVSEAPGQGDDSATPQAEEREALKRTRPRLRKLAFEARPTIFALEVADSQAPAIRRAFLAQIAKLKAGVSLGDLLAAVRAGDAGAALGRLGSAQLAALLQASVGTAIERTAMEGAEAAAEQLAEQIGEAFGVDAGRVLRWARPYLGERIGQLAASTEEAVRGFFRDLADGALGDDAEAIAQLLRETWGLHRQQAAGVRNVYRSHIDRGKSPITAAAEAGKLARRRLQERAQTIAEHESLIAANRGNGTVWEGALEEGKVSEVVATWYTAEDEDVDDVCAELADQEINLGAGERFSAGGQTFREPPEPHPGCRCGLLMSAIR